MGLPLARSADDVPELIPECLTSDPGFTHRVG
jgi:hypothetical protein